MTTSDATANTRALLFLFLVLLLTADGAFAVLHLIHIATPLLPDLNYSLERDGGFAEWFQYTKELWVVVLLMVLWRRHRRPWVIGWVLLYSYFLLDDAVSVHEIAGDIAYRHLGFGPALGLRATDLGELFVTGMTGVILFLIIGVLYRRSSASEQAISKDLLLLALLLAGFGVGLDMLHSFIEVMPLRYAMGMVEDGGEMVIMSVTCWYVLSVADRQGQAPDPPLVSRVRRLLGR